MLDLQQPVRQGRDGLRVAEVGLQQVQRLSLCRLACKALPEQALECRPAEEVGVDDLMTVAAQDEVTGLLQQCQHQRQLHQREVLHLVDDHEVVHRARNGSDLRAPSVRDQVAVEQPRLIEPAAVALEKRMRRLPLRAAEQALASAERQVVGQRQRARGVRTDHAPKLLEQALGTDVGQRLQRLPVALEPGGEGRQGDFATNRHAQSLEQLPIAEEVDLVLGILEPVSGVQRARTLRKIGRQRDIQHPSLGLTEPRQRHRRLARSGRSNDHQWCRMGESLLLDIVEHDRLVQQFEAGATGP